MGGAGGSSKPTGSSIGSSGSIGSIDSGGGGASAAAVERSGGGITSSASRSARAWASGSAAGCRRAGPSASASCRASSSSVAPRRRLSSRCSRMASSRIPTAGTLPLCGYRVPPAYGVLPAALGAVERGVRLGDQRLLVLRALGHRRDAEARGDRQRLVSVQALDAELLDGLAHALGGQLRALQIGLGQDHGHFLAAVARGLVDVARQLSQHARDLAQDDVSLLVAVGVVDRLEVVDVEHDQRDRLVEAAGTLDLARERVVEVAQVA